MNKWLSWTPPVKEKDSPIINEETIIGRSRACDITLQSMLIAPKHARIVVTIDGVFLENLSNKKDILFNGEYREKVEIANNQEVGLGVYKLLFLYAQSREEVVEKIDSHTRQKDASKGVLIDRDIIVGRDFTCDLRLNEPRYASLKGIMKAKKVKIEEVDAISADSNLEIVEFNYPPQKEAGKIVGDSADAVPELLRLLHEEAKVL
jgi:pSer/pThr/pTyr-binding forkhead associated (FHA) protein